MNFDPLFYPYPSRRSVVFSRLGMVATSQPLAAQAGLEIMKRGGNAIDAAVAAASCLTVVEPTSNGIGGDAFALVWSGGKLWALNSSGPAPQRISLQTLTGAGHKKLPQYGLSPVTVPGAPACWAELSRRFGKLPLTESMHPAIVYAEAGFPVSPVVSSQWKQAFRTYRAQRGEEFRYWFETFAPLGRAPVAGEISRLPDHAATLAAIAETKAEIFYRGNLSERFRLRDKGYGSDLSPANRGSQTRLCRWPQLYCRHTPNEDQSLRFAFRLLCRRQAQPYWRRGYQTFARKASSRRHRLPSCR